MLALARLLVIALSDMSFVAHVLDGQVVEPFLPESGSTPGPERKPPRARRAKSADSQPLAAFVGGVVEIVSVVTDSGSEGSAGHLFVTIGRVVEVSPNYIVLEGLRGHHAGAPQGGPLLLGTKHVLMMRLIADA
jgi:hypothetical protein